MTEWATKKYKVELLMGNLESIHRILGCTAPTTTTTPTTMSRFYLISTVAVIGHRQGNICLKWADWGEKQEFSEK